MIRAAGYGRLWRPSRYWLAAALSVAILVALVVSSVASLAIGPVPLRATVFGLPAGALAGNSGRHQYRRYRRHDGVGIVQPLARLRSDFE